MGWLRGWAEFWEVVCGGGCGQFGKRFEMGLKVRNHSGLGMSPKFLGETPGAWKVIRGERWMSFVEDNTGDGKRIN